MTAPAFIRFDAFLVLCRFAPTVHQRVLSKLVDGVQPFDLVGDERAAARRLIGDVSHVEPRALPVVAIVKGRAAGLSRLSALRALYLALTVSLAALSVGEVAYVLCGGPKLKLARIAFRFALSAARALRDVTIESETADAFTIVRPDGRRVVFETIAASRGGDAGRGVHIVCAVLDEAAFYFDENTAVANDRAVFSALVPRLLPGAQILIVSSPWAESGLLHEEFSRNWGAPRTALAVRAPTLVMRDDAATRAMVGRERERDPDNARREFDAEFLPAGASSFFDRASVVACVDRSIEPMRSAPTCVRVAMGLDVGLVRDSSAAVVIHVRPLMGGGVTGENQGREGVILDVAELTEWKPRKGAPLALADVAEACAELAGRHGAVEAMGDHHELSELRRALGERLNVTGAKDGAPAKLARYVRVRELLRLGRVRIPGAYAALLGEQLAAVVAHPTPGGGVTIRSPRRAGQHGDVVSALVLAVALAEGRRDQGDERILRLPSRTSRSDPRYARRASAHAEGVATRDGWATTAADLEDADDGGSPFAVG